jgi:hypothetical protein
MFDDENMKWVKTGVGVAAVMGAGHGFFWPEPSQSILQNMFWHSIGFMFLSGPVVFVPIVLVLAVVGSTRTVNGGIKRGFTLITGIVFAGLMYDVLMWRGALVMEPVIALATTGSVKGSFWNCENYVVSEDDGDNSHASCLDE